MNLIPMVQAQFLAVLKQSDKDRAVTHEHLTNAVPCWTNAFLGY